VVKYLIRNWWPPLTNDERISEAEIRQVGQRLGFVIPAALQEWYNLAGRRQDFIGNQDQLLAPEELHISDNTLVFCIENQAVVQWGIRLRNITLPDPPVHVDLNDYPEEWKTKAIVAAIEADRTEERQFTGKESTITSDPSDGEEVHTWIQDTVGNSLSEFLTWMVASATLMSAPFNGYGPASKETRSVIRQNYEQLRLTRGRLSILLSDGDTLVSIGSRKRFRVAAKNRAAIGRFLDLVGADWGQISHSGQYWSHEYGEICSDVPPPNIVRAPYVVRERRWAKALNQPGAFPPCHFTSSHVQWECYPHGYVDMTNSQSGLKQ
jgi:hypothetical protein